MSRFSKRRRPTKDAAAAAAAEVAIAGQSSRISVPLQAFELQPASQADAQRRKPGTAPFPKAVKEQIVLGVGRSAKYVQRPGLPEAAEPGATALGAFLGLGRREGSASKLPLDDATRALVTPADYDDEYSNDRVQRDPHRHRRRRAKQYATWRDSVIPALVQPFLRYIHNKDPAPSITACTCTSTRGRTITLADLDGTSTRGLQVCACNPAAQQLVSQGYFPSAPIRPSMAFSLRLLELISLHSLNVAPNITAWATTLEAFWARRGFSIDDRRELRTRLGNAVHWYQVLVNYKDSHISRAIADFRVTPVLKRKADDLRNRTTDARPQKRVRFADDVLSPDAHSPPDELAPPDAHSPPDELAQDELAQDEQHEQHERAQDEPQEDAQDEPAQGADSSQQEDAQTTDSSRSRPSEYLRQRCPLCFGGPRPNLIHTDAHAIVCLDANFQQKRRRSTWEDPEVQYVDGRFVDPEEVAAEEQEVNEKRKRPARKRTKGTSAKLDDDVLDECEESFLAAQEKVTKASKNYYADTGLMAVLCRHDRVLYVANMTTPGERQHYALVLLRKVLQGLPADWMVGVLYDIACQLSRSIEKHDLLHGFGDRLIFAVSVFHAYGHQWACQIVFHPRKRKGFGLTDGEGCERFWSALRALIPCLRVSGFHRRLFVLDRQIEYNDDQNLFKMGRWLGRKWRDARQRLDRATLQLEVGSVPETELRAEWEAQVATQLRRAPRQSKYAGEKEIDKILLDVARVDELQDDLRRARADLRGKAHKMKPREVQDLTDRIEGLAGELKSVRQRIVLAKSQLGTGALRTFDSLRGDAYVTARVNARALRVNIRMAVRAHKFEREKLERNYRRQVMQNKEHTQTRDLVHKREKNLAAMVRKYNTLVTQMAALVKDGKVVKRRMQLPRRLDVKRLFQLDVDDEIWQEDPGLGPQDEGLLPRWQVDQAVREGIRHMLEAERCREELERVEAEAHALLYWWREECQVVRSFCAANSGDDGDRFYAEGQLRLARLMRFAREWDAELVLTDVAVRFLECTNPAEQTEQQDPTPARQQRRSARAVESEEDVSDEESEAYSSDPESPDEDEPDAPLLDIATAMADTDSETEDPAPREPLAESPQRGTHADAASQSVTSAATEPPPSIESRRRRRRAFSPDAIDLCSADEAPGTSKLRRRRPSDDSDSSEGSVTDEDDIAIAPSARSSAREKPRKCGSFGCTADDITRMESRTAWLSGMGLAVFAESHRVAARDPRVGHLPPTLFIDVKNYHAAREAGDSGSMDENKEWIRDKLKEVPAPSQATKWLIVVHIESPQHWVLLEVRWQTRQLLFYDSLAATASYALRVKALSLILLELCEGLYTCDLDVAAWTWIGETRGVRQTNWYDCGPFVAADFVSLLTSDSPSSKIQRDMGDWRRAMASHMRTLEVWKGDRRTRPLTQAELERAVSV